MQGEEEEEEEYDGSELRYCYCNGVSYGEMVACDMENCQKEWFHLGCVGLTKAPMKNGAFYFVLASYPNHVLFDLFMADGEQ